MAEYHDKFAQLSRYAPNEVADDADKQCRFLKGLYCNTFMLSIAIGTCIS